MPPKNRNSTTCALRLCLVSSAAIGHELYHALEILHEPDITTTQGMFFHFFGTSMSITSRFETNDATEAGARIEREVRTATRATRDERQLSR
jgi:hypothetical protein